MGLKTEPLPENRTLWKMESYRRLIPELTDNSGISVWFGFGYPNAQGDSMGAPPQRLVCHVVKQHSRACHAWASPNKWKSGTRLVATPVRSTVWLVTIDHRPNDSWLLNKPWIIFYEFENKFINLKNLINLKFLVHAVEKCSHI